MVHMVELGWHWEEKSPSREETQKQRRIRLEHLWTPYGKWTCADGREVLYNRSYRPIWEKYPGQKAQPANRREWVVFVRQEWFFNDGNPPWSWTRRRKEARETRKRINVILSEWGLPELA